MQSPLISVIVPCYNQAQYLDECLQSVLDQTFTDWECIIINDGSPDNTEKIAKNWVEKDSRFKYLYKENGGVSSARNFGIEKALGEWILPLDGDDKIGEKYMQLASQEFYKNPTIIYCEAEYFGDKEGKIILAEYSFESILINNAIFCTAFFKKNNWIKVGGYDFAMIYGVEDWEFWISILKGNDKDVLKLSYVGFYYRIKSSSRSTALVTEKLINMQDYIYQKHIKIYQNYFGSYINLLNTNRNLKKKINYFRNSKLHKLAESILNKYYNIFK